MFSAIRVDLNSPEPLHRQLYGSVRRAILDGLWERGSRVPSSRELAESLGVSRTTVIESYEQLTAEGYLEGRHGSGTYVTTELPDHALATREKPRGRGTTKAVRLSMYAGALRDPVDPRGPFVPLRYRFNRMIPDIESFPMKIWSRLIARLSRRAPAELFDYSEDRLGYVRLRGAISDYLRRSRAVDCDPDRVLIVNGSQQGLDLCARLLGESGETIAVEDPGYLGARRVFEGHRVRLLGVPVDENGIQVDQLPRNGLRAVYVTPSHQYPMGVSMSLSRRMALLEWAGRTGTVVIEDDYDSEFRFSGRPLPSLQGLTETAPVIYIGTFSKVLFPGIRIGYMVLPTALVDVFARAKWIADRQCPLLEQLVLADFIHEGHLEHHLRRMRTEYKQRRQALTGSLAQHFGNRVRVYGDDAGMHLTFSLETRLSEAEVVARAAAAGVAIVGAGAYYLDGQPRGQFVAGFASLPQRSIREAVRRLATAVG